MSEVNVFDLIKKAKKVAIFTHKNPDPDAYGSVFALKEICKNLKVKAEVFAIKNPDGYLDNIFPLKELKTDFEAKKFDLVLIGDLHILSRLESCFVSELEKSKNIFIIDHHEITENEVLPTNQFVVEPDRAATCEIVFNLMKKNKLELTSTISTYLWAGLVGDTGRFLFNNLSENVLEVAKQLYKNGANVQLVYDNMFRKTTLKQVKLHQVYLNKINFLENNQAGFVVFSLKDMKKLGVEKEDIKKYVGEITRIEGVKIGFLCMEYSKNHYKFSVRTNGVNTVKFTTKMGGGGHENASGFELDIKKRDIFKKMPDWIKELLNE